MHSLLDPIITVDGAAQSLPQILHRLSAGDEPNVEPITSFDALRRHQKRAWHLFLVQTAAMIGPCESAEAWEEALVAEGGRAMWELETPLGQPAFMQPPTDSVEGWKEVPTPDEAGVLSTTAGHTIKDEAITQPRPEHWIYSIVTTQTTGWYAGGGGAWQAGVRMNKGYADRPYVSLVSGLDWGSRFGSDVATARKRTSRRGNVRFLWLLPYGEKVTLEDCHTLFVEICRRFRFHEGRLYRKGAPRRIPSAEDFLGAVGDPWIPIDVTSPKTKAVSTTAAGFTYPKVAKLLANADYKTPSLKIRSDQPMWFVAESLATDRTMTDGFHERAVLIPSKVMKVLKDNRDRFAERSESRFRMAASVKKQALRPALKILQGIDLSNSDGYKKLANWESSYESSVDEVFFGDLWDAVDQEQEEAEQKWKDRVVGFARDELRRAKDTVSDTQKWKLWPQARSRFYAGITAL